MKRLYIIGGSLALLLLAAGFAGGVARRGPIALSASVDAVASRISYQGRLTDPDGAPLDGAYTMRFIIYDADEGGAALWDSQDMQVEVYDGLLNVMLDVTQTLFDGQALWLSITVDGQTLSPRQEILPAPYALSLRPGAMIVGDEIDESGAVLAGYAPATGAAFYANATGGAAVFGGSAANYGVWGASADSWGGYFTSGEGHGIRVHTDGADHYDHGAYITATGGYGVYAQSAQNQAVRGEAGDISNASAPLGAVGVVGIGANRGAYGSSEVGIGLYGVSQTNYGVWGQSNSWHGVTGRTSLASNNYGLYTPDNLYSLNINMGGALMQVMQNGGSEPLSPGDVVVFSGVNQAVEGLDSPLAQVSLAGAAHSPAVAGVVYSRFNLEAVDPDADFLDEANARNFAELEVTPAGDAAPGEYILVVVQGIAQVNASALDGRAIEAGDLLSTGESSGRAMPAATLSISGFETAVPGTILGKALEPLVRAEGTIHIYVTLQ